MYTKGSPVTQGTQQTVSGQDQVQPWDIGGYIQEYDANNLSALSTSDYDLCTNEAVMTEKVWNETLAQGLTPMYVETTITYTNSNSTHIKVVEHHGLKGSIPIASVGHGTYTSPLIAPIILWAATIIVALITATILLVTYSPVIFKMAGLTPEEVQKYFGAFGINIVIPIVILAVVGIGALALMKYMEKH